ncbi:calcium-binding protein [Leisingera aquimarina]|uniref:calcium-binding protein n=1 Tax=Leisingera aquimarina TaxID=476529 RepID=UPI000685E0D8|nr:calcium-binding protein [Leisingera aquimarina]
MSEIKFFNELGNGFKMNFEGEMFGSDVTRTLVHTRVLGDVYVVARFIVWDSDCVDSLELVYDDSSSGNYLEGFTVRSEGRIVFNYNVSIVDQQLGNHLAFGDFQSILSGNDKVLGTDYSDRLIGFSGADKIVANSGDDSLFGGAGNDRLLGGAGDDRINGGRQSDYLKGGNGADTIRGGGGADTITGGAGDDLLLGNAGRDLFVFNGSHGNDTVRGFNSKRDSIWVKGSVGIEDLELQQLEDDVRVKFGSTTIIVEDTDLGFFLENDPLIF